MKRWNPGAKLSFLALVAGLFLGTPSKSMALSLGWLLPILQTPTPVPTAVPTVAPTAVPTPVATPTLVQAPSDGIIPGSSEILLKLNGSVDTLLQQVLNTHALQEILGTPRLKAHGWIRVRLPLGRLVTPLLGLLKLDPRIREAIPNHAFSLSTNDPYFSRQWNLRSLRTPEAWNLQPSSNSVVIAVLDSGISPGPDLAGAEILPGFDFINFDTDPSDDHQHGTMMASILAATAGNSQGTAGVAPGVALLPVKVLGSNKLGNTAALVEGLYYAAERGADVVNLSLAYAPGLYPGSVLDDALESLNQQGILVVAAAGNFGTSTVSYPAAYPSVIAVGATQPQADFLGETRATYSNYGTALDLLAPGGSPDDVDGDGRADAILGETFDHFAPEDYAIYAASGTSGAAAQVSGVIALLLSSGSPAEVRAALEKTAVGGPFSPATGMGRVDAFAALQALRSDLLLEQRKTTTVEVQETAGLLDLVAVGDRQTSEATVKVLNANGTPAANMWVYGHFAGAANNSQSAKTNADGMAKFVSSRYSTRAKVSEGLRFVVDRVTEEGEAFDADAQSTSTTPSASTLLSLLGTTVNNVLSTTQGLTWILSPEGQDWLMTPAGHDWLMTPAGHDWLMTPAGHDWLMTPAGHDWLMTPAGHDWLMTPAGHDWLMTPAGHDWLMTPAGHDWLMTPAGHDWLMTPAGHDWLMTPAGHDWLMTPAGHDWLMTPAGHDWLMTPAGHDWQVQIAD